MRADTEHHIAIQLWFPRDEIAHHVDAHHLLMYGVSLDVLAVERDTFLPARPAAAVPRPTGASLATR